MMLVRWEKWMAGIERGPCQKWCTHLVDPYGFAPQLYLIHNFTGIFGVLFCQKLAEAKALMCHGDSVFGQVHVD